MLPSRHVIASLSLSAILGFYTQSFFAGMLCFIFGVFVDVDHIIDYMISHRERGFNLSEIYWFYARMPRAEDKSKRLYIIFHCIEISILLWVGFVFSQNIYILAIALGYTEHLLMDGAAGMVRPQAYFLSYRLRNNFKTVNIMGKK